MYILQVKHETLNWFDVIGKGKVDELKGMYTALIENGFPITHVRIVKTLIVEVKTTVEVVK